MLLLMDLGMARRTVKLPSAMSSRSSPSGRRKGDSFDRASRHAPPSLLLFAPSWRHEGDLFDRILFDRASRPAPLPLLLFASSGRRKGDSFDRASRHAPPSPLLFALSGRREGDSYGSRLCHHCQMLVAAEGEK